MQPALPGDDGIPRHSCVVQLCILRRTPPPRTTSQGVTTPPGGGGTHTVDNLPLEEMFRNFLVGRHSFGGLWIPRAPWPPAASHARRDPSHELHRVGGRPALIRQEMDGVGGRLAPGGVCGQTPGGSDGADGVTPISCRVGLWTRGGGNSNGSRQLGLGSVLFIFSFK